TGERLSHHRVERKSPLRVTKGISLDDVRPGDCLVAFSRKEVIQWAAKLDKHGISAAVIYGALTPEVRQRQAESFRSGQAKVVVATDAIGMGLNLPIKRVVFTAFQKFDGEKVRPLNCTEVKQIAGRAGRYGIHDQGEVTALASDTSFLSHNLSQAEPPLGKMIPIAPLWAHVDNVMRSLDTDSVGEALSFFERHSWGKVYSVRGLESAIVRANSAWHRRIDPKTVFALAFSPVDLERNEDRETFHMVVSCIAADRVVSVPRLGSYFDCDDQNIKPTGAQLQFAETHARQLTYLAWAGTRFPGLVDLDELAQERQRTDQFVNRALSGSYKRLTPSRRSRR
ncbi:MAG: hypothetical protein LAT62_14860, partial [Natronospirillum sp.]|uniref:helicase-related protein n=1 Tax=Natronospirillum sp. TaxID=2812955 RepID=UPI0025D74671